MTATTAITPAELRHQRADTLDRMRGDLRQLFEAEEIARRNWLAVCVDLAVDGEEKSQRLADTSAAYQSAVLQRVALAAEIATYERDSARAVADLQNRISLQPIPAPPENDLLYEAWQSAKTRLDAAYQQLAELKTAQRQRVDGLRRIAETLHREAMAAIRRFDSQEPLQPSQFSQPGQERASDQERLRLEARDNRLHREATQSWDDYCCAAVARSQAEQALDAHPIHQTISELTAALDAASAARQNFA